MTYTVPANVDGSSRPGEYFYKFIAWSVMFCGFWSIDTKISGNEECPWSWSWINRFQTTSEKKAKTSQKPSFSSEDEEFCIFCYKGMPQRLNARNSIARVTIHASTWLICCAPTWRQATFYAKTATQNIAMSKNLCRLEFWRFDST